MRKRELGGVMTAILAGLLLIAGSGGLIFVHAAAGVVENEDGRRPAPAAPAGHAFRPTGDDLRGPVEQRSGMAAAPDRQQRQINEFLLRWVQAWQKSAGPEGEFEPYASCYANIFFVDAGDRQSWLAAKERINRSKDWIRVQLDNVAIVSSQGSDYAVVRFSQQYSSSNYSDTSGKTLILQRGDNGWQIVAEHSR